MNITKIVLYAILIVFVLNCSKNKRSRVRSNGDFANKTEQKGDDTSPSTSDSSTTSTSDGSDGSSNDGSNGSKGSNGDDKESSNDGLSEGDTPKDNPGQVTSSVVDSIPKTEPNFSKKNNLLVPSALWAPNTFPKPANRWWDNMVIDRYGPDYGVESPIGAHPYIVKGTGFGLEICYPRMDVQDSYIDAPFANNISLGSAFGDFASRQMDSADDFTFKLTWKASNNSMMSIPITRGSPYITAEYVGAITPQLKSAAAFLTINESTNSTQQTKFKIVLNNGQTWILYSSSPITLEKIDDNTIRSQADFTGTIQIALATDSELEAKLDQYKLTYVTSGAASYSVSENQATINFNFETNNDKDPLLMGLPHHKDSGLKPAFDLNNPYITLKGKMFPVVSKVWTLTENLPNTTFFSSRGVDTDKVAQIVAALQSDKNLRPTYDPDNPYYYGKQMARMGRLALIAEQLGEDAIKDEIITNLKADLEPWINRTNNNPLMYDPIWGSISTRASLDEPGRDFGIGEHNDVHFHFGYFVDTFGVIARTDKGWVNEHKDWINSLIRAYVNPHLDDPYFPHVRHKDWYMGHSWASGIVSFSSGNNMESTSESVNSYYALMLLGDALGDSKLYEFGQVMTATEIRSAQKYWQIKDTSEVYPAPFKNNKAVGILWDTKVEHSTWFGTNVEWIHGIQMLPYTPITEALLPKEWIIEEYPLLSSSLTRANPVIEERWKGYVYMTHAIIDKNAAWTEVQSLNEFDNGNSRTNAYYWVATRPGPEKTIGAGMK
ncbi:MAG: glycosyl hydrolase [Oligoflexales bacterium]